MIDTSTPVGRAVAASLRLAEKRPWSEISLLDIADEAGLTLAELSRHVSSKAAILRAFVRLVDDAVLHQAERREPEESPRERLFDVLMTRLEAMQPYKAGLRRIAADGRFMPELIGPVMRSQTWMLAAAGIPADGAAGLVRTAGLASVYAATFQDWLADDDAGLARTMAGLDRRLRRGEGWVKSLDSLTQASEGLAARAREIFRKAKDRNKSAEAPREADTVSTETVQPASTPKEDPRQKNEESDGSATDTPPSSRIH